MSTPYNPTENAIDAAIQREIEVPAMMPYMPNSRKFAEFWRACWLCDLQAVKEDLRLFTDAKVAQKHNIKLHVVKSMRRSFQIEGEL